MTFRFIHNKDGISLFDTCLDQGVVITLEEFKTYILDYTLPVDIVERSYTKFDTSDSNQPYIKKHYLGNSEGVLYEQDDWEIAEYVQSLLPIIIADKIKQQNTTLDLIKNQIQQRQEFNSDFTPLGIRVLNELNSENLLKLILDKGDLRSFIGVLIYTVMLPNETLAIDYLKETIKNNFNQDEINKIIKVISKLIK